MWPLYLWPFLAARRTLKPLVHWGALRSTDPYSWRGEGSLRLPEQLQPAFNLWSQFLALRSTSAHRCRRRVMQKSLKALRVTEHCRNSWDSWRWPGQKWSRKLKITWRWRSSRKGKEERRKQFLHKGKSVLCACTVTVRYVVCEYLNIIA